MDRTEIFAKVREGLMDALEVDEEEVGAESSLMDDLGAESIDFLDITFRMEKLFGIKIPEKEMYQGELNLKDGGFIEDGKVTEAGMAVIKEKMPDFDLSRFSGGVIYEQDVPRLITVGTLVLYLEKRLADA